MKDDADRPALPGHKHPERLLNLIQGIGMGEQILSLDLAHPHQLKSPVYTALALAPDRIEVVGILHADAEVSGDCVLEMGHQDDVPALAHNTDSLLEAGAVARGEQHKIGAVASGLPLYRRDGIFLVQIDHHIGAQFFPEVQPLVPGAGENNLARPQGLGALNGHEPDGSGAYYGHRVAGHETAGMLDTEESGARGGDDRCLVEGNIVGNLADGIHVIHRVLGETAIGSEAVSPMSLGQIAVIEAGGILAVDAIATTPAALVHLDGHPVSQDELVHRLAQFDDSTRVLVADDKSTHRGLLDHAPGDDLHVTAAD
ncbi:hypothetical protein SDC9_05438 [bioreactor metagenome]|uniref:Uncharacterized protein n=1 Tax=bioreactor metagenome TaxID=1076179 RepID=A0A644T129_9ZZZZ